MSSLKRFFAFTNLGDGCYLLPTNDETTFHIVAKHEGIYEIYEELSDAEKRQLGVWAIYSVCGSHMVRDEDGIATHINWGRAEKPHDLIDGLIIDNFATRREALDAAANMTRRGNWRTAGRAKNNDDLPHPLRTRGGPGVPAPRVLITEGPSGALHPQEKDASS